VALAFTDVLQHQAKELTQAQAVKKKYQERIEKEVKEVVMDTKEAFERKLLAYRSVAEKFILEGKRLDSHLKVSKARDSNGAHGSYL
jgi:hypothetical protein